MSLLDNKARNHSHYTKTQQFLERIDHFRENFLPISHIDPNLLFTKNRLDIDYRKIFLIDVLEKNLPVKQTLYYQFVSDPDRKLHLSGDDLVDNFLKLTKLVRQNGIQKPLIVGKYNSTSIKTQYSFNKKTHFKNFENNTRYQLIDGAHRLSLALFLKLNSIPVKIYTPLYFEIPNFTDYIHLKEKEYIKNISDING